MRAFAEAMGSEMATRNWVDADFLFDQGLTSDAAARKVLAAKRA